MSSLMSSVAFCELLKEFQEMEADLLGFKAGEYATSDDRLQNFREVAAFEGREMEAVCLSYLLKHVQSIKNQVVSGKPVKRWFWHDQNGNEGLKQRIADTVNYLHLMAAIIEEKKARENPNGE